MRRKKTKHPVYNASTYYYRYYTYNNIVETKEEELPLINK